MHRPSPSDLRCISNTAVYRAVPRCISFSKGVWQVEPCHFSINFDRNPAQFETQWALRIGMAAIQVSPDRDSSQGKVRY